MTAYHYTSMKGRREGKHIKEHRPWAWGRSPRACAARMGCVAGRLLCQQSWRLRRTPLGLFRGSLAVASKPVQRPVGGSQTVHHRVVLQRRRLLQVEGGTHSVHPCQYWHCLAVPDVSAGREKGVLLRRNPVLQCSCEGARVGTGGVTTQCGRSAWLAVAVAVAIPTKSTASSTSVCSICGWGMYLCPSPPLVRSSMMRYHGATSCRLTITRKQGTRPRRYTMVLCPGLIP